MNPIQTTLEKMAPDRPEWDDLAPENYVPIQDRESNYIQADLEKTTLDQLDTSHHELVAQAVKVARLWASQLKEKIPPSLVLISGKPGAGKTHIARSIWHSQTYVQSGLPCNPFFDASQIFFKAYTLINEGEELHGLLPSSSTFIIIDDLGKEIKPQYIGGGDWPSTREDVWFAIINHAYRQHIPLVITSNLTLAPNDKGETLPGVIGKYSFSRLLEMAPKIDDKDSYVLDLSPVADYRLKLGGRG